MDNVQSETCGKCMIYRIAKKCKWIVPNVNILHGFSSRTLLLTVLLSHISIVNVLSQVIHSVSVPPLEAVRIGSNARITCRFQGNKFQIQYIAWTKVFIGGGKANVYGYDKCSGENQGFYDLENRSVLDVANPSALRQKRSISTSEQPVGGVLNWHNNILPVYDVQDTKRTLLSHDGKSVRTIDSYGDGIKISPNEEILVGSATLTIQEVKLEDEARYECLVKPVQGPAETDIQLLTVVVLPTTPRVKTPGVLVENRNYTLLCHAFVGRPTGAIQWFMKKMGGAFKMMPDQMVETQLTHYSNGTSSGESRLVLNVTEDIHSAILRCEVSSRAMRPWERRPFHQQKLNILYPPRKGRILYDSRTKRYYCDAEGNPKPTYIWMWVFSDGTKTILSTSPYLDLSPIQSTGIFQFQCLASNMIETKRHTIVMKTKIKIQGTTPDTGTTTTVSPTTHLDHFARNESESQGKWTMGMGEPYGFEKAEPRQHYDDRGEPVPVWDIIHGYVGHDKNPVSSNNYNISVISQTLGNKGDIKSIKQVKVKNSASSYIQPEVQRSVANEMENVMITDSPKGKAGEDDESTSVYLPDRSYSTVTAASVQHAETTTVNTKSNVADQKSDLQLPQTEISEMSPENYDYGNDVLENNEVQTENWENNMKKNTKQKVKKESKSQLIEKEERNTKITEDITPANETLAVEMPLLPVITISELVSGRYRKRRPSGVPNSSSRIVPYTKKGKPDFGKILKGLPSSQKRYVQRRIGNINKKFNKFLVKYQKQLNGIEGKEGPSKHNHSINDGDENSPFGMYDANTLDNEAQDYYYDLDQNFPLNNNLKSQTQGLDMRIQQSDLLPTQNIEYNELSDYQFNQQLLPLVVHSESHQPSNKYGIFLTEESDTTPTTADLLVPVMPFQLVSPISGINRNYLNDKLKYNLDTDFTQFYDSNYVSGMPSFSTPNDNLQDTKEAFLSDQYRTSVKNVISTLKESPNLHSSSNNQMAKKNNFENEKRMNSQRPSYTPYRGDSIGAQTYPSAEPHESRQGYRRRSPLVHEVRDLQNNGDAHKPYKDWVQTQGNSQYTQLLPEAKESPDNADNGNYMEDFEKVFRIVNSEFDCTQRLNGPHGGGCRAFYRCIDSVAYKVECIPPYVFNKETGHCDEASKTSTACGDWRDCRSKPNRKYADMTRNCEFYFTCYQGMFLGHNKCNPGTIFNEKEQVCDWPDNTAHPCGNG